MPSAAEDATVLNTLNACNAHPTGSMSSSPVMSFSLAGPSTAGTKGVDNWSAMNIGQRLGSDAVSAASASILIAPIVTIIDCSIVQKASTGIPFRNALIRSIQPLKVPHHFLTSKPFLLIFALYTSTYFTANAIDSATSALHVQPATTVTTGPTKFVATSAVNMTMCVYKDSCFARMFGAGISTVKIPKLTYTLFALRDSITIFASFNLPTLIAPHLSGLPGPFQARFRRILSTQSARDNTAQFLAPALMQIFSTPIHLLGLDLYNRQGKGLGIWERLKRVKRDWAVSAFARMGRIVPAFGVAGVVNRVVRGRLMGTVD